MACQSLPWEEDVDPLGIEALDTLFLIHECCSFGGWVS